MGNNTEDAAMEMQGTQDDTEQYLVLSNDEGQYSIWASDKDIPLGWKFAEKRGLKAECLAYVNEVWTDMRPLSLIKKMSSSVKK